MHVDSTELISVVAFTAAAVTLGYASVLDVKTRRVPNGFWILLSLLGVALLVARVLTDGEDAVFLLILIPIGAILSDVYLDTEGDSTLAKIAPVAKYATAVVAVCLLWAEWGSESYFQYLLAVPILMMFFVVMYLFDVIKGGADAKALIALAILFPVVPEIGGLPLAMPSDATTNLLFPFALGVLIDAAILVVFLPIIFLVKNLSSRDVRLPQMFLGYRIDSNTNSPGFVWLMEGITEGRHRYYTRPRADEDISTELRQLREHGATRVWVTPKIPFIVPMFAGLILAATVGNIILMLFGL